MTSQASTVEFTSSDAIRKTVVVHFVGAGRSGSTLLNIILDNHSDIIGAGELAYIATGWSNGDYCSCGLRLGECPFWSSVKRDWLQRKTIRTLDEYLYLQTKFERYRMIPKWFSPSNLRSEEFLRYRQSTFQLYQAIQDISGKAIIADSSKSPARAMALSTIPEIDLRLIFLVRNVTGFVRSKKKSFVKDQERGLGWNVERSPTWKSVLQWLSINMIATWVASRSEKCALVRYENLINDPVSVFTRIGTLIDRDLSGLSAAALAQDEFCVGHIAAGNRLRMKKLLRLNTEAR